ncbi:MAG: GGDEF domain-containing protein, partial [Desulfovibrionaceae bacterium]|nr:GGDEF domain-containing protein [Desulfovibrionaceae bacterium]
GLSVLGVWLFRCKINPLEKKAYVDMLTGITNRAGLNLALDSLFKKNLKSGALFLIDLDNFKEINDNLGHPIGDECLKRVAYLLKEVFKDKAIVARLGGDEFLVFVPNLDDIELIEEKAKEFLEIILYTYKLFNGEKLIVTASIGIALYPLHGKTQTPLYNNADNALYMAKNAGRNRYVIYDPSHSSLEKN